MSVDGAPLVVGDSVARTYGTGHRATVAVHGATFEVRPGDRIALTGPSGSGKSTLLHLMAGLEVPTAGSVVWPGIGGPADLRPGPVAVVFQGPSLLPSLDVAENVALPLVLGGTDPAVASAAALAALERVGIADLADALPERISGGQAQRVAVARALAGNPVLLVADEPTGQLDHRSGLAVIDAIVEGAPPGSAVVVCTHDEAVGRRLDTRWRMTDGRLHTDVAVAAR